MPSAAKIERNRQLRHRLAEEQGYRCCWCGGHIPAQGRGMAKLEHIVPRKCGGASGEPNIAVSCTPCNSRWAPESVDEMTILAYCWLRAGFA